MKLLSSIIVGAIHCSQQSVKQPAAVDEFADQRLTCKQQCFKYETVDIEFLSISFSEIFGFKQSNAHWMTIMTTNRLIFVIIKLPWNGGMDVWGINVEQTYRKESVTKNVHPTL